jgi:hypothetical protein
MPAGTSLLIGVGNKMGHMISLMLYAAWPFLPVPLTSGKLDYLLGSLIPVDPAESRGG